MAQSVVIVGVEHGQAAVDVRERLAFGDAALDDALHHLKGYVPDGAILSTCGRTELVAAMPTADPTPLFRFLADSRGIPLHDLERDAFVLAHAAAVRHLCRVAAGLESVVLGEPQILGQLRAALGAAQRAGAAGPLVSRLIADALHVGKLARTETGIARNRLSIPHAALDLAAAHLATDGLRGRQAVVVGAGEMAALAAKLLRAAGVGGLVIANRTEARAAALAEKVAGRAIPLDGLPAALANADLVVSAAACPAGHLIDRQTLRHRATADSTPFLAIDLAVPRSIDPDLTAQPGVTLAGVDDLDAVAAGLRQGYEEEIAKAETMVEAAVAEFAAWLAARDAAPTIADLRQHAETIRTEELAATLRKLGHLSERDRNLVAALSSGIVNKLLHQPVTALRTDTADLPLTASTRRLFDLQPVEGA